MAISSSYFIFVDGSITILDQDGFDYETLTGGSAGPHGLLQVVATDEAGESTATFGIDMILPLTILVSITITTRCRNE